MALENATYINQLDQAAPDGLDPKSQGDDHLRLIKKAIKQTFPNITGPVSATQDNLNALLAVGTIPTRGMIQMWYGDKAVVPAGWLLCDGNNGTPNLLNKFVMGAGAPNIVQGTVGGTENHTHASTTTVYIAPHAITVAEMPQHSHGVRSYSGASGDGLGINSGQGGTAGTRTTTEGGGAAHGHDGSSAATVVDTRSHIPPFMALWFIMKA